MDIHFDRNTEDCQKARRLHAILKKYCASEVEDENRSVLTTLMRQIESCLADPGLNRFSTAQDAIEDRIRPSLSLTGIIKSLWDLITGPSHREQQLGKQRREQLERAEHAEASAFEALAETSDIKKKLEQAQREIHELETTLARIQGKN